MMLLEISRLFCWQQHHSVRGMLQTNLVSAKPFGLGGGQALRGAYIR